jgi:hypothetical protein
MRFLTLTVLLIGLFILVGCSEGSNKYDLKSPCVSNDDGNANTPCIRRTLLDNYPV